MRVKFIQFARRGTEIEQFRQAMPPQSPDPAAALEKLYNGMVDSMAFKAYIIDHGMESRKELYGIEIYAGIEKIMPYNREIAFPFWRYE